MTLGTPKPSAAYFDDRLQCPSCDYNLSGLIEPRCPECGGTFDWDAVQREAANPPRISFESLRGVRRVSGFVITWATVMFGPWIFARQTGKRIDAKCATAFAAICFAGTLLSLFAGADWQFITTWLLTAAVYLVAQMLWLSLVDPQTWFGRRPPLRFWLLVGFYTSAVMMTEFAYGPPQLLLSELIPAPLGGAPGRPRFFTLQDVGNVVWWAQMLLWLAALGCCYAVRIGRPARRRRVVIPAAVLVSISLLILYAAIVEHVGGRIYNWVTDPF
jgi:hypothetical protein